MPWRSDFYDEEAQSKARKESKLEALYHVAAMSFKKYGFRGTSLSEIASALGITKAALYTYVESKQALAYELHMISIKASEAAVTAAIDEGGDGLSKLRRVVEIFVKNIVLSPTTSFLLTEEDALLEEQAKEVAHRRKGIEKSIVDLIETGIEDGSIAPCDPLLMTFVIIGAMQWVPKWFRPDGKWTDQQVARGVSLILGRALAKRSYSISTPTAEL